jgi:sugar/nucleoside kinase (ribokinase family)
VIVLSGVIEPTGEVGRTMITDRGANALLATEDVDAALDAAPDAVHLHLSGYTLLDAGSSDAGRRALDAAAERGMTVSVDAASAGPLRRVGGPAFISLVRRADVLFANVDEARALLGDGTDGVETLGATDLAAALAARLEGRTDVGGTVVVKLGAAGAVAATSRGAVLPMAAPAVDVQDTTGAGDAFAAGFLGAWLGGAEVGDALTAGTAFGALAVTMIGARPTA